MVGHFLTLQWTSISGKTTKKCFRQILPTTHVSLSILHLLVWNKFASRLKSWIGTHRFWSGDSRCRQLYIVPFLQVKWDKKESSLGLINDGSIVLLVFLARLNWQEKQTKLSRCRMVTASAAGSGQSLIRRDGWAFLFVSHKIWILCIGERSEWAGTQVNLQGGHFPNCHTRPNHVLQGLDPLCGERPKQDVSRQWKHQTLVAT